MAVRPRREDCPLRRQSWTRTRLGFSHARAAVVDAEEAQLVGRVV